MTVLLAEICDLWPVLAFVMFLLFFYFMYFVLSIFFLKLASSPVLLAHFVFCRSIHIIQTMCIVFSAHESRCKATVKYGFQAITSERRKINVKTTIRFRLKQKREAFANGFGDRIYWKEERNA